MRILVLLATLVLLVLLVFVVWFRDGASTRAPARSPDALAAAAHGSSSADPPREVPAHGADLAVPTNSSERARAHETAPAPSLGPRCRVFGRVVDEERRALADVAIALGSVGGPWSETAKMPVLGMPGIRREGLATKTDAGGRFEFEAPLPTSERIALEMTPSEFLALARRDFGPGAGSAGGAATPRLVEGDNDLGEIVLTRRGVLAGRVRSADGGAIGPGGVSSHADAGDGLSSYAQIDPQSAFRLAHLPPGDVAIDVEVEGWISPQRLTFAVRTGEITTIDDIVLERAAEIRGVVVDQDGAPAAKVDVNGRPERGQRMARARTRDDGTFTLYLAQAVPHTLGVSRGKGYEAWGGDRYAAESTFAPGSKDVRIVLTRSSQVTLHVVDAATRAPIESFGVAVADKLQPGVAGTRFQRGLDITPHPGGDVVIAATIAKHDICVRANGYAAYQGPIVPDPSAGDRATIVLSRASQLRGRAVLAGAPVAGVTVSLQRETLGRDGTPAAEPGAMGFGLHYDVSDHAGRSQKATTGDDGRFEFTDLDAGTFALTMRGATAGLKSWRAIAVPKTTDLDLGDLVLDPGATVHGRVVTSTGESPVGFRIGLDERREGVVVKSIDGTFEFHGLAAGSHVLGWNRPGEKFAVGSQVASHAVEFEIAAGETRDVLVDVTTHARCTVNVLLLRGGKPAPGLTVRACLRVREGNAWLNGGDALTNFDGRASLGVDGGTLFDLMVSDENERDLGDIKDLVAPNGGTMERTIELRIGTLTVELPAALSNPLPGWELSVRLVRDHKEVAWAGACEPDTQGAGRGRLPWTSGLVELGDLPAGTFEATVSFERIERNPSRQTTWTRTKLRELFKTAVTIEDGKDTRIVVP